MTRKILVWQVPLIWLGLCSLLAVRADSAELPEQWQGLSLPELVSGLRQIGSSQGREAPPLMRAAYEQWLDGRDRAALQTALHGADTDLLDELRRLATRRMRPGTTEDSSPVDELLEAIAAEAAAQLGAQLAAPETGTSEYQHLRDLYELAKEQLAPDQRHAALARLSKPDELTKWSLDDLRMMLGRIRQAEAPESTREAVLTAWLDGSSASPVSPQADFSQLSTSDLRWLCWEVLHSRSGADAADFSVRWTGFVEAPSSGAYTFSIFPVDFRYRSDGQYTRQTTAVWIDGRQVLDSTRDGWCFESEPVSLQAGHKTPIRVDFSVAHPSSNRITGRLSPAVARLFWEGPGVSKSVVPSRALSPPEGSGNGLRAEYRVRVEGSPDVDSVTVVDPVIDRVWERRQRLLPVHPEVGTRMLDALWSRFTNPSDLDDYATLMAAGGSNKGPQPPLRTVGVSMLLSLLGSSQRAELVDELLARPAILLDFETIQQIAEPFWKSYVAVPEQAVDLLGAWAHLHPDAIPRFGTDFYGTNRQAYREVMIALLRWHRPHFDLFEQRYLEMPDGGCCLPVAYILSYGYATEGRMEEWIEKLDERLADSSLGGDQLVNWLLARAQAEDIRHGDGARMADWDWGVRPLERFLAGRGWIETACLAAVSEPVRLRAYGELITRLAAEEQLSAAREMLAAAASRCTGASSVATLARWQQEIADVEAQFRKQHEQRAALAERAYVQRLRQRYQGAADAGDEAALTRYGQMLAEAGNGTD